MTDAGQLPSKNPSFLSGKAAAVISPPWPQHPLSGKKVHPPKDGERRHDIHRACSLLLRLLSRDVLKLCLQLKGFHYVINRWVSLFFQIPDFWRVRREETTKLDEARFPFFRRRATDLPEMKAAP